jgi:hypothetical protein
MTMTKQQPQTDVLDESAVTRPPDKVTLPKLPPGTQQGKAKTGERLNELAANIGQMKPTTVPRRQAPVVHERPRQSFD